MSDCLVHFGDTSRKKQSPASCNQKTGKGQATNLIDKYCITSATFYLLLLPGGWVIGHRCRSLTCLSLCGSTYHLLEIDRTTSIRDLGKVDVDDDIRGGSRLWARPILCPPLARGWVARAVNLLLRVINSLCHPCSAPVAPTWSWPPMFWEMISSCGVPVTTIITVVSTLTKGLSRDIETGKKAVRFVS
jgi:hypothetical protein